jgi:hypothetical protein
MAGAIPELERNPRTTVAIYREWQHKNLEECIKDATLEALARVRERLEGDTSQLDIYLRRMKTQPAPQLDMLLADACVALRGKLLIVFDQFEEYSLYHAASTDATSFDAQLARTVNREDIPSSVMLSLREDQLASLDRFRARIPHLFANTFRLEAMDEAAARLAIAKPLEVYRSHYPSDPVSIEEALVSEVIEQVATGRVRLGSTGGGLGEADDRKGRVEAPFLQLVMTRLWHEEAQRGSSVLRAETFAALGGATGIVRGHLDRVLDGLSEAQRDLCARFFDRLVTPSGSKVAYRIDDLAATAEATAEEVGAIVSQLTGERRVLRNVAGVPGETGSERVEIFHDVLAVAVLDWQRRFGEVRKQAIARLAAVRRATRIAVPIVVVMALLAAAAAVGAYLAQRRASSAREEERAAKEEAQAAEHQRDQARAELSEATGALVSARAALEQVKSSEVGPQADDAKQAIKEIDQALRPRVYFHGFTREQQLQSMQAAGLIKNVTGFAVYDFQFVKEGPERTELRYFRTEDERFAAQALKAIRAAGLRPVVSRFVVGQESSKEIRPGHLEVWFARPVSAN